MSDEPQSRSSNSSLADGRTGIFFLISVVVLIGAWLWFKSINPFNPQQRFSVHFHEVAALNDNAPILVNGVRVGSVESVYLKGKDLVYVNMQINVSKITIPVGSTFRILSNNVVGVKYIDITLPHTIEGQPPPPVLDQSMDITGNDPGRPEIVIDNLTTSLSKLDFDKIQNGIERDAHNLSVATENISVLSKKFQPVAASTLKMEDKVSLLAVEMRGTSKRLNKIINDPKFTTDLRETAEKARQVADTIQATMKDVNSLLSDKELRADVMSSLERLNDATLHVQKGIETFERLAEDKEVRGDLKSIMVDAKNTMSKVEKIVNSPEFGSDLRGTLGKTRKALDNVNIVTNQVNQILNKRFPLLHLMFGRPGKLSVEAKRKIKNEKTVETTVKDKDGVEEKTIETKSTETKTD